MFKNLVKKILKHPLKLINSIYTYFYYKNSPKRKSIEIDSMIGTGEKVLVLSPHVDDETIGLGATLLKYKKADNEMALVYLTDGGGSISDLSRSELVNKRRKEGERVKEVYGFDSLYFLDELDGQLDSSNRKLVEKIIDILEEEKPAIIYTPFLIDGHRDHVETTKALIKALEVWNENFDKVYMYEVNCPIIPLLVNSISIMDEDLYNKKRDKYKIFTSQWAMGFGVFRLLDRRKRWIAKEGFGAEIFVKTNFKSLFYMEKTLEKADFKPEYFRQLSSEYNLLLSFTTNKALKEEYSQKISSILSKELSNNKILQYEQ
ncbi:conserved hypothetical protein [[Clostridium] ultunense Esp]|uniref:PIG-L family deacetylase n=1 Tax=[Clostridium] ultunense Esp TaxID=1288971 RepID=M1ZFB8_9FIRM|nr:PIG-L family deacetylase [Schnuerera ultunensis]CCQ96813.1 conserved hypothetical protein [[Clostridium] ultunense Esp]SHD75577.1 conserved protein of unknown function [[Clostridium] ultunense Esp]